MLRFHTQTAGVTLQAQQPLVNVVRVTVQALAAVLGGTQSLHTNSYDEALGLPTEEAARIALRTQQVIGNESGVADFIDPLGGSWAVEALTDEIERRVDEYFAKIDELGGMVRAIEQGFPQREIERRAYEHQRAVERKERIVVGVNEFVMAEEEPMPVATIDPGARGAIRSRRVAGAARAAQRGRARARAAGARRRRRGHREPGRADRRRGQGDARRSARSRTCCASGSASTTRRGDGQIGAAASAGASTVGSSTFAPDSSIGSSGSGIGSAVS